MAVDQVSFAIGEGELRCLIGPNVAGKSTFFKCLTGQYQPTSGRILWRGKDVTSLAPFALARLGIGTKTQVPSLFDGLTVWKAWCWRREDSMARLTPASGRRPLSSASVPASLPTTPWGCSPTVSGSSSSLRW